MANKFTPHYIYARILAVALILFSSTSSFSQPTLSLNPVISSGLSAPIQLVNAGDGSNRIFIVQQAGTIRCYDASFNYLSDFLTVSPISAGGEQGLLSMAFHPQYATNGFFYVYYDNANGDLELARYKVSTNDPNVANPASKVILKTIPHPGQTNHNGGELHFGTDGYLYLSTGDGGGGGDGPNNAQNLDVLLGKILRFNVNTSATAPYYSIPPGNPFGTEVFAYGLRNPFRWSFDRQTGDMWIGDVGQDSWEEVNYRAAGSIAGTNFGWRCYEGNSTFNTTGCGPVANYVFPAFTYPTPNPSGAVTGGVVYRGPTYTALRGYYIAADFFTGDFYKIISNGAGGWNVSTQNVSAGIADFGETENGEIYAVSIFDNSVSQVLSSGPVPVTLVDFTGTAGNDGIRLNWRTSTEINMDRFEIEYSTNGTDFNYAGTVVAQNASNGYSYTFLHQLNQQGIIFYRLKIINADGSYTYSDTVRVALNSSRNLIAPTVVTDGIIHLYLSSQNYRSVELIAMDGKLILRENIEGRMGEIKIPVSNVARGMYVVKLSGNISPLIQKIIIQ